MAQFEKRGNWRVFLGTARVELPVAIIGQFCSEAMLPGSSKRVSLNFLLTQKQDVAALPSPQSLSNEPKRALSLISLHFVGKEGIRCFSAFSPKLYYNFLKVDFQCHSVSPKCHSSITASTRNDPVRGLKNI